ncbi:MAG: Gfo/Idh/MocA family oxidoreductase [Chloroflexi bacterium]|nr:Gfo/Idh/MocA family oxidoreductase [Chloroflexota bacterium]MBV9135407.1 Gfo/Idh/MocA family oxidoreductase [Chloroflexota bacterium]MBV9893893.1 Gfo/Idh/MocA family oxidoreductase [Chloroflexota bacterium]
MSLGVAIFGAGRAGHGHARAITQVAGANLVAVFDADSSRAAAFAETHGCEAYTTSDEVLKRDDVQVVMVALPNFLHERATIEAASARKHVFLEKPMADTLEECDRMLKAVQRAGVQLLVAHSQRYFASTIRAREMLQGGEIGEPVFATDTWYKNFGVEIRLPWFLDRATGGGMWLMNGAHMIDRTSWVLDTEVASVRAWIGSPFHNLSADDANMAFLQLRNGKHATIVHAGYKTRGVDRCEVEITCTNGMLRFDSYSNQLAVDRDGAYVPIEVDRKEPFAEELANLVATINGIEELRVPPVWGRHIVEVLLAAEESSRTGREVSVSPTGLNQRSPSPLAAGGPSLHQS